MNIRICVAFVIASFLAATCTSTSTANAVDHDQRKAAATDYVEDTTTDSPMLRRGLAWTPVWWERIKNSFQGNDLKLCTRRSAPAKGSLCGRNKSTCFFGNKACPTVGAHPTVNVIAMVQARKRVNGVALRRNALRLLLMPTSSVPARAVRSMSA